MSGIVLNEDCNHFVYTRDRAGIAVGPKELDDFILQYRGTQLTDFCLNVNGSIGWYPCKSRDNALVCLRRAIDAGKLPAADSVPPDPNRYVRLLEDIYVRQGLPMHKIWCDRLRECGIHPWISLRVNDVHCNDDEENFLHSSFFREHHALRRGAHHELGACDYFDNALDFCCPEVRQHLMDLVVEVLDDFDPYGLELDWMRECTSLRIGREAEGTALLNEFMRQVGQEIRKAEQKHGHPIKLAVRVPSDPLLCLRLGLDVFDWIDAGLIDLLTVTSRWATVDNDMPVDLWKRLVKGKNVTLAAGLEILLDPMFTEPHKVFLFNSPDTARGSAAAYLSMGAERIYLFNYMDSLDERPEMAMLRGDAYRRLLSELGSLETIGDKPRRHVVTYNDVKAPGVPHRNPLPLECARRGSGNPAFVGKPEYKTLRIPTGPMPEKAEAVLVLGLPDPDLTAADFSVYLNAEPLVMRAKIALPQPCRPELTYYAFPIKLRPDFPSVSLAEIACAAPDKKFTVEWAEIGINEGYLD